MHDCRAVALSVVYDIHCLSLSFPKKMPLCCVGGVCVPYSALVPLLLYGLKWIVQQLSSYGLIPSWIIQEFNRCTGVVNNSVDDDDHHPNNNNNNSSNNNSCSSCIPSSSRESEKKISDDNNPKKTNTLDGTGAGNIDAKDGRSRRRRRGKLSRTNNTNTTNETRQIMHSPTDRKLIIPKMQSDMDWYQYVSHLSHEMNHHHDHHIILYFTAPWCIPCQKILPVFMELAQSQQNTVDPSIVTSSSLSLLKFVTIDMDSCAQVATQFQVMVIPTFLHVAFHMHSATTTSSSSTSTSTTDNISPPSRSMDVVDRYVGSNIDPLQKFVARAASAAVVAPS
jgi:thiol-disulfide isomerase/thioredoxin